MQLDILTLISVGFPILFMVVGVGVLVLLQTGFSRGSRWERLRRVYPAECEPPNSVGSIMVRVGGMLYKGALRVGWDEHGVCLGACRMFRWRRDAILLPWEQIQCTYGEERGIICTDLLLPGTDFPPFRIYLYIHRDVEPTTGPNLVRPLARWIMTVLLLWLVMFPVAVGFMVLLSLTEDMPRLQPYEALLEKGLGGLFAVGIMSFFAMMAAGVYDRLTRTKFIREHRLPEQTDRNTDNDPV